MTGTPKHPIRALLPAPRRDGVRRLRRIPAVDDPEDVTVFTVTLAFETGRLDYDDNAFDGYAGGPVILRGVDGKGNTFSEAHADRTHSKSCRGLSIPAGVHS